ncbi:MAG: N-acetyltransferase, partial [Planctomycetota bacterium]
MSEISVVPVQTKRQQKQFLMLPWKIYRGDPFWIPPLRQNQKELAGFAKHPFYEHSQGQAFLAMRNGEPVGRILAIVNNPHIELYKEQRGFFGFFESIDDQEVATGLFDAAKGWLAERDILDIRGPMNPSMNYEIGLLIEGFDSSPQFMMTYNRPYYAKLIEGCGFRKCQDMYAFWGHVDMLETLDKKMAFVVEEATRRFGVKLRRMDTKNFVRDVRTFLDIYNSSLAGTWGFTPLSEGEIDHMAASMKRLIAPEMTSIAEVDGRPVAAAFALLDFNPRIKKIDGRLFPFGFLSLFWNRRAIKDIRLISANVVPEYQKWGLGVVILSRLVPEAIAWGVREVEFSWVLESNHLSYKSLKRGGAKLTKTYRLYDCGPNSEWSGDA